MRWLCILLLCVLPLSALAQDSDRDRLTAFLEDNLSGAGRTVTVTGFRGALSSRATVERLTIADDEGVWLTLTGVVLDWNRLAVLSGNLEINELTATEVVVDRLPQTAPDGMPAPEAGGFALPDLPVAVQIGRIAAGRIVLGAGVLGQPVEGTLDAALTLADGEGRAQLAIERLDDGPDGTVDLQASYANASGLLILSLTAEEAEGGIAATLLGLPGAPAARLTVEGSGPVTEFAATVALATDGVDRLAGRITLNEGAAGARRFAADLRGDLAPLFLPAYADFFGPEVRLVAVGSRAVSGQLALTELSVAARSLTFDGALTLAPDGLPLRVALTGRLADPGGGPVLLPLVGQRTEVAQADLTLSFDAAAGEDWSGRLAILGLSRADLAADRLVLEGSGRIARRAGGNAGRTLGGTLTYAAEGLAPADPGLAAALGPLIAGAATMHWTEGAGALTLGDLTLDGDGYGLSAAGRIDGLESGYRLVGTAALTAADLSRFAALAGRPLSGAADLTVTGEGSPLGGDFDLTLAAKGTDLAIGQAEADNLLRGVATVDASVARDASGTRLRALTLVAGRARVTAQGLIATAGSDLTATLDLPDLGVLGPGYGGGLAADVTLRGTADAGDLTLAGTARDLATGQPQADRLLAGDSRVDLALRHAGGTVTVTRGTVTNPQADLRLTGLYDPAGSNLALEARIPALSVLGPGYRGALQATAQVTGTAAEGRVTVDGTGRGIALGQPEADRLLAGDSVLRLDLGIADRRLQVNAAQLTTPQITASATGTLTAEARRIAVEARLANLALLIPEFPGPLRLAGDLSDDGQGYTVDLRAEGPGQIAATVTGRIAPLFRTATLALRGSAQAALANAFLGQRSVSGPVSFDLALNGPLRLASLSGPVRLTGGRLSDPGLPFSLTGIAATATLAGGAAQVQATAEVSSGGQVTATGRVGLAAPNAGDLAVTLSGVRLRDPNLYTTTASGTLRVTGPLTGGPLVTGRIDLGETELRIPSSTYGASGAIPDLRHVGEPPAVRATRARAGLLGGPQAGTGGGGATRLDLILSAPNRVFLRGRGLDAELGGEVTLRGTTAAVQPSGGFQLIRGRLDLLGKRLVLTEGQIDLQGDLVPYVRVVAANDADGVTTFVVIEGRADAPEVDFTSAPELPEEEVLARLLFGQGIANISPLQAAQLAAAIATLAGQGGEGIVGRLRRGFGLDDFDFQTSETGGTTVRAGKYLSENVYSEVEVDETGKSRINLNLDIKPGVTVRGQLGSDGDAGIGVFLERDY